MSRSDSGYGADDPSQDPYAYEYEGARDPITGERPIPLGRDRATAPDNEGRSVDDDVPDAAPTAHDADRPAEDPDWSRQYDTAPAGDPEWSPGHDAGQSYTPLPAEEDGAGADPDPDAERYGQIPRSFDPSDPDPVESYGTGERPAERAGYSATADAYGAADINRGASGRRRAGSEYGVADPTPASVCPRHPDRVAYVRCQRCDRPACPECQRPAAVGVLCVDCAREMERQQRQTAPRTTLGGATSSGRPLVTYTIIGLCVLAYLGQTVAPGVVENLLMFAPFRALAMPWTFLTSGFLHGSLMHLAFNMYALWVVGQYLERAMGPWRYLAVYLVSILAGHTAVLLLTDPMTTSWVGGTVGASGGVFGLFGSMFVINRRMGAESGQIIVLIVLNLLITFMVPGISWQGHLGGLIVGTATTAALFATRPKASPGADRVALARRSALMHAGVIAGAVLLCLGLVAVRAMTVPTGALAGW